MKEVDFSITPSIRNQTISSDNAMNPETANRAAQAPTGRRRVSSATGGDSVAQPRRSADQP